jgi:hypothetical protein
MWTLAIRTITKEICILMTVKDAVIEIVKCIAK